MSNTHTKPTEAEIEVCAYCIWEVEGRPEGQALNHWVEAEKQLAATRLKEEPMAGDKLTDDLDKSGNDNNQAAAKTNLKK